MRSWIGVSLAAILLYMGGLSLLAARSGEEWTQVEVFNPAVLPAGLFWGSAQLIVTLSAWFLIAFLPGWPWAALIFPNLW